MTAAHSMQRSRRWSGGQTAIPDSLCPFPLVSIDAHRYVDRTPHPHVVSQVGDHATQKSGDLRCWRRRPRWPRSASSGTTGDPSEGVLGILASKHALDPASGLGYSLGRCWQISATVDGVKLMTSRATGSLFMTAAATALLPRRVCTGGMGGRPDGPDFDQLASPGSVADDREI